MSARPSAGRCLAISVLGLLALAGCSTAPATPLVPFDERDPDLLYVGDCFSQPDVDALDLAPDDRIPCDEPHNVEIVGLLARFDGEPLPESGEADATFLPLCFEEITAGVEGPLAELPLTPSYTGSLAADGVTIDGPVVCVLMTRNGDIITGSAFTGDPHDLIGDYRLLNRLEPGTCFTLARQFNLALPAECEPGVLMFLGVIASEGGEEFPGEDELRRQRGEGCPALIPEDDDRIDPRTLSGTLPGLIDWMRGARDITCDVEVS